LTQCVGSHPSTTSDNDDRSRPEIEPWHEQQQPINQSIKASKTTKAGPRGGISKRIQEV
jgi:hypothetical protein